MKENLRYDVSTEKLIENIKDMVKYGSIEPSNAELLIKLINNADNVVEANKIAHMGTIYRETGFYFDERLEKDDGLISYFAKEEQLSFKQGDGLTHKLIIGDNYPALQNLLISHSGMIDVIYIDPPYASDSMGQYTDTVYENAITRDNLLSQLKARLELAYELLSDDGIILCSIDDKNQAYVKCLFDDVFGEVNFITNVVVNRPSEIASALAISKHEYVLVYTKDVRSFSSIDKEYTKFVVSRGTVGNENQTQPIITFPAGLKCYNIKDGVYKETRKVSGSKENIENLDDIVVENGVLKYPVRLKARWRASNDMRKFFDNECKPTKAKISGEIIEIYFENDRFNPQIKKASYEKISSLFDENKKGSTDINNLNLGFSFPKSSVLIKALIKQLGLSKNITVLDFYAGSGTTGQAVLELNKEDGGNRTFILCTNEDKGKKNEYPNGIARDVTSKRLKRVMTGSCYDNTSNFKWLEDNEPLGDNLDVYMIKNISPKCQDGIETPFDVIDETLYNVAKLSDPIDKIEWVCQNFERTQRKIETDEEWLERLKNKKGW